jgi:hypothetical protein
VDKGYPCIVRAWTRCFVDHAGTLLLHLLHLFFDILYLKANVVDSGAPGFQEPGDGGVVRGGLDQFDITFSDFQEADLGLLFRNDFHTGKV